MDWNGVMAKYTNTKNSKTYNTFFAMIYYDTFH